MTTSKKKLTVKQRRKRRARRINFVIVGSILVIIVIAGITAENNEEKTENNQKTQEAPASFEARRACEKEIKRSANYPATVSFGWFDTATTDLGGGRWKIQKGWSAKNAFGVQGDYVSFCIVRGSIVTDFSTIEDPR